MKDFPFEFTSEVKAIADVLACDVYSGPFYLSTPGNSEDVLSLPDRSVFLAGWADADGPTFYGSEHWQVAHGIISDAVDNHPRFYDDYFGNWMEREPEGYETECWECGGVDSEDCEECERCDGTGLVWEEPSEYYEVERSDIARGLLGRAYSDIL